MCQEAPASTRLHVTCHVIPYVFPVHIHLLCFLTQPCANKVRWGALFCNSASGYITAFFSTCSVTNIKGGVAFILVSPFAYRCHRHDFRQHEHVCAFSYDKTGQMQNEAACEKLETVLRNTSDDCMVRHEVRLFPYMRVSATSIKSRGAL